MQILLLWKPLILNLEDAKLEYQRLRPCAGYKWTVVNPGPGHSGSQGAL